ncbi:hypothetical protein FNV43_RR14565 [Rhamnella rubrinervis]|uniref:Uncharacterized protein n=1 Tax=Rhamnella rubrinervis TaxID=2594499 RepID=A0A8K0H317_9ROSA|nr:hypothetical protein FNV43_RR14565 [Rhamnella rubrinervis]
MEKPQTVNIVEVCRVAPVPDLPSSASPKSLPLTLFDLLWLRFSPVQRLFFYEISCPNSSLFNSIIPKLKHSLSLTLHHFFPLCGNLIWPQDSPKPIVSYVKGDGVSLTIAESNMDFYHLSDNNNFRDVMECQPLIPNLEVSHEKASVMALQVTVFPNSGFCIGITNHHAVLDGKTSISFVKSWARICKFDSPCLVPEHTPFYDRTVIKDPAGLETVYADAWLNLSGPNNRSLTLMDRPIELGAVRGTFQLSGEDIEKLRKSVRGTEHSKRSSSSSTVRISTFSIICGYAWACVEKAKEKRETRAALGFPVDCRRRLKPSNHPTYFGNCIMAAYVGLETEELLGENGVSVTVEAINEAISGLEDGVLNGLEKWGSVISNSDKKSHVGFTTVAGSSRFEVYKTDFGWGTPRKVEITSIDRTGAISVADSPNGNGGVELGLVLKTQEMEAFASLFAKGLEALI